MTSRGNERKPIFRGDRDRWTFLDALAELPERFGTRLHAYVLMENHYHLVLETPEANLSRAAHWLNVTYTTRFNRRHRRSGHLLQGRFKGVLIQTTEGLQAVGRYVHLNPVRVQGLGLGKEDRAARRAGVGGRPKAEVVAERLAVLRGYRWSSYRAYAGYEPAPGWLWTGELGRLCGGRTLKEQQAALRGYTEGAVREGRVDRPWADLVGGVVLGTEEYAREMLAGRRADVREQRVGRLVGERVEWGAIVKLVEKEKGERWEEFRDRYGDWGRDVALWLGRRAGRLRLGELARLVEVQDYMTVATAVRRVGRRMKEAEGFRLVVERLQAKLSKS